MDALYSVTGARDRGLGVREILRLAGIALFVVAVAQQMRRPAGQRDWQGRVLGFIPYDFRRPTLSRILSRWWNPADRRLLTEHVFGIGWSVNLAQLLRFAETLFSRGVGADPR